MATLQDEKLERAPGVAHQEGEGLGDSKANFAELAAREAHYGYSGARALLSSPYVFGAALLASMGGFSYGYDQGVISLILVSTSFWSPLLSHQAMSHVLPMRHFPNRRLY